MSQHVLIFDSGVGGLSILHEIRTQLPDLPLHYLMDNAAYPYGTKSDDFLRPRIVDVCLRAVEQIKPALLVIACNTASTLALPALREALDIPVVGVVPAIKVAAELTTSGHIGLLATPATVNRSYTDELIATYAAHCQVRKLGSTELVQWAENWILHQQQPTALFELLNEWLTTPTPLSHVVLGCTHFPLLKPWLSEFWPQIQWVDSGPAIARRVKNLLSITESGSQAAALNLYWTDAKQTPAGAARFLSQLGELQQQSALQV